MGWREQCKGKIVTAAEAVSHIKSGDKVMFADWIGEPPALVEALVARGEELENVEIIHGMSPGPQAYLEEKYRGRVRFCEVEVEESPRLAAVYGADIVPAFLLVRGGAVKAFMKGVVGDEVLEKRLKELL